MRQKISRALTRASLVRFAIEYTPDTDYSTTHSNIVIGIRDQVWQYCQTLKFCNVAVGMCCASGEVVLSPFLAPPELV